MPLLSQPQEGPHPVSEIPASARAVRLKPPSWLETRLVLGVLLVLGSVLAGTRVLASADRSQQVWATTRALAPGTVLIEGDLRPARVRLFGASERYAGAAGAKPVGYVVRRGLGEAELLPLAALSRPEQGLDVRDVTVPVPVGHLPPDLAHGDQVDIYVTPSERSARSTGTGTADPLAPRLVLRAVAVQRVVRAGGLGAGGQDQPVLLTVRPDDVLTLVAAMAAGHLDLVLVPRQAQGANPAPAGAP